MQIDPTTIAKVYSGKPGCGCGCRGRYFTDERNIRRVVKIMNAREREIVRIDGPIFSVEDDTRYFWAYGVDA